MISPPVSLGFWFVVQQGVARVGACDRTPPARLALGAGLAGAACALAASALSGFATHGTTWRPSKTTEASALVTTGAHALSRNPMYLSHLIGLIGSGLASPRPWTAVAALAHLLTITPQIEAEEVALTTTFGDEYREYCSRVRRWL